MAFPNFYNVDFKIFWGKGMPPDLQDKGPCNANLSQPPTLPAADAYFKTFWNPCWQDCNRTFSKRWWRSGKTSVKIQRNPLRK